MIKILRNTQEKKIPKQHHKQDFLILDCHLYLVFMLNIYVANISYNMVEEELEAAFAQYGSVRSAKIIVDRETGKSRGFGFVEMEDEAEGQEAIEALNGTVIKGRELKVREARDRR